MDARPLRTVLEGCFKGSADGRRFWTVATYLAHAEDPFGSLDLVSGAQRATIALASVASGSRSLQVQRRIDLGDSHRTESGVAARRLNQRIV
jgi:hypothetical protein